MLLSMDDPYAPVPAGTKGTVQLIDDQSQIHMKWDNGSALALIPGEDSFRKLTDAELAEEQDADISEEETGPVMRFAVYCERVSEFTTEKEGTE